MSMIRNLRDLARHLGVRSCSYGNYEAGGLAGRIGKAIFRATECGCVFDAPGSDCVTISGYAEGADAECESYQFNYPFGSEEFDSQLELCDEEGVELWNEWNSEDWEGVYPDDIQADDDRQRAADMNAELGGGL